MQKTVFASQRPVRTFSDDSTESVPDSLWSAADFLLGVGTVIIQPATCKVIVLYRDDVKIWFLPKGRKDVGESLEQAALREGYEESGYRAEFLPLNNPTRAPARESPTSPSGGPAQSIEQPCANTEPIYVSVRCYDEHVIPTGGRAGEYITFWYVACIRPDAVREDDAGMSNEKHFTSHLMPPEEAMRKMEQTGAKLEAQVVKLAYALWSDTDRIGRK